MLIIVFEKFPLTDIFSNQLLMAQGPLYIFYTMVQL